MKLWRATFQEPSEGTLVYWATNKTATMRWLKAMRTEYGNHLHSLHEVPVIATKTGFVRVLNTYADRDNG